MAPDECGTPVLCVFYGLLGTIFLFAIYSNVKGEENCDFRRLIDLDRTKFCFISESLQYNEFT